MLVWHVVKRFFRRFSFADLIIVFRHFMDVAEWLDTALMTGTGKVFVNCVFGRSRYKDDVKNVIPRWALAEKRTIFFSK